MFVMKKDIDLSRKLSTSPRYGDMLLTHYVDRVKSRKWDIPQRRASEALVLFDKIKSRHRLSAGIFAY